MLCEKCHHNEALVHITEMDAQTADAAASTVTWHFCEACGEEYQREFQRFFDESPPLHHQGMSKQEMARATQEFRAQIRSHMAAWVSGRQQE